MDPVNAVPVNALFWNLVSKMPPLRSRLDSESAYFVYRWRHRPTPRPLAFDLLTTQRLITTTTTTTTTAMVDYMLVFVLQKILSLLGLLGQKYYAPLPLCWAKKDYGQPHMPHYFRATAKGFILLLSVCIQQGSPTFLKLRATTWVLSHTKGCQFDTLFWNNKFAQFAFSYIW